MDTFLTVQEITKLLKVERRTVIRWIAAGQLRGFRPAGGRLWRVHAADFQQFVNKAGARAQGKRTAARPPAVHGKRK